MNINNFFLGLLDVKIHVNTKKKQDQDFHNYRLDQIKPLLSSWTLHDNNTIQKTLIH